MKRPGEWARVPISPKGASTTMRNDRRFELKRRSVDGTEYAYGRYIGENGEHK